MFGSGSARLVCRRRMHFAGRRGRAKYTGRSQSVGSSLCTSATLNGLALSSEEFWQSGQRLGLPYWGGLPKRDHPEAHQSERLYLPSWKPPRLDAPFCITIDPFD